MAWPRTIFLGQQFNFKQEEYCLFFTQPSIEISTKTHLLELSTVTPVVKNQINILNERPRDISLAPIHLIEVCMLSHSASEKHSQEKNPTNLCAPRELLLCLPCLIIVQSCYFGYTMNKPFAFSRCVICVSCSVHLISTYAMNEVRKSAGSHGELHELNSMFTRASLTCQSVIYTFQRRKIPLHFSNNI